MIGCKLGWKEQGTTKSKENRLELVQNLSSTVTWRAEREKNVRWNKKKESPA